MSKREIKFRGWIPHEEIMVGENYLVFWSGCIYYNESGTLKNPAKPYANATLKGYSIMNQYVTQFTGLKDKNDKEIYEGDFVKDGAGVVREVRFYEGGFCLFEKEDSFPSKLLNYSHSAWNMPDIEIVGNIYQNPEMLEGEME